MRTPHTVGSGRTWAVVNQDLKVLDCGDDGLNCWLALQPRASERQISNRNRKEGTTVQSIRVDELLDRELRVPPANEQRRIVEKIEELFARVNAARDRELARAATPDPLCRRAVRLYSLASRVVNEVSKIMLIMNSPLLTCGSPTAYRVDPIRAT